MDTTEYRITKMGALNWGEISNTMFTLLWKEEIGADDVLEDVSHIQKQQKVDFVFIFWRFTETFLRSLSLTLY